MWQGLTKRYFRQASKTHSRRHIFSPKLLEKVAVPSIPYRIFCGKGTAFRNRILRGVRDTNKAVSDVLEFALGARALARGPRGLLSVYTFPVTKSV
jgi:hypothetical protein